MKNIARFDNAFLENKIEYTDEGYLKGNAIVTRTGIFKYQNFDGSTRYELRHADDIWKLDSINSMMMLPITNNHPSQKMVSPENVKSLQIGFTGENIKKQGDNISTSILITDKDGIKAVENGRRQLSLGYLVDLVDESGTYNGEKYDARQTNIRYNHLAIVDKARAGDQAIINLDTFDAIEILKESKNMSKRKVKIDDDEVFMNESEADFIDKLQMDLKNLQEERNRVEGELEIVREKLEKAEAERDALITPVSEMPDMMDMENMPAIVKMDSKKFIQVVNERATLITVAHDSLSDEFLKKIDKLSNFEIKKEIVKVNKKSVDVTGKSKTYIDCMYDLITCEKSDKKVKLDNVSRSAKIDSSTDPILSAQLEMITRSKTFINKK